MTNNTLARYTHSQVLSFARVVGEMVSTGISEGHPAGSLLMEIKGYKFAQNKVSHSVAHAKMMFDI